MISSDAPDALSGHWAVSAVESNDLYRADRLVKERLVEKPAGNQAAFSFQDNPDDEMFLERIVLPYELAAIEGLDELRCPSGENLTLRDQAIAASCKAFGFRRLMAVPSGTHDRLYFVLQLSALGCCGGCWFDLMRWYEENDAALIAPNVVGATWDRHLLYQLFHCWICLFRKAERNDLDRICEIIAGLRDDQKHLEEEYLNSGSHVADRAMALRLSALYHWAKGTEIVAQYMMNGQPFEPFSDLDKYFNAAVWASTASADAQTEVILRWLHAAACIMATASRSRK